ncbi:MAG TPA: hypothetical protein VFN67_43020 [Polyangiales bacterium]|nr:hypothetical protein [Polyangiales bacterium]
MTRCSNRTRHLLALSGLWLASAATGLAPIADGDIFWHLAGGYETWRSGELLTQGLLRHVYSLAELRSIGCYA